MQDEEAIKIFDALATIDDPVSPLGIALQAAGARGHIYNVMLADESFGEVADEIAVAACFRAFSRTERAETVLQDAAAILRLGPRYEGGSVVTKLYTEHLPGELTQEAETILGNEDFNPPEFKIDSIADSEAISNRPTKKQIRTHYRDFFAQLSSDGRALSRMSEDKKREIRETIPRSLTEYRLEWAKLIKIFWRDYSPGRSPSYSLEQKKADIEHLRAQYGIDGNNFPMSPLKAGFSNGSRSVMLVNQLAGAYKKMRQKQLRIN